MHPRHLFPNIVKGQVSRASRINTDDIQFEQELDNLTGYFEQRGYGKNLVRNAIDESVWGLVNNAGISKWGEVEWNTVHDYKRVAEINLFGSIRTTLAFIPLIKKSKGRMVFMSSTNAIITPQCNSIYCVTKRGLEAFCDSLRIEMKKFGVIVCVVRPGDFTSATKILKKQTAEDIWSTFSEDVKQVYSKEYVDTYIKSIDMRLKRQSRDPDEVVSTVVKTLMISNPNAVWTVASVAETSLAFICSYFPYSVLVPLFYSLGGEKERRVLINQ
ncbi:D-beta-hydroxybutyrate dehydrogenase, mitochondrial-like [Protopterus annectens]|uniref:D-beta-hydroxybutyrate dehydrogenase, mitochondrial-like n=1 Tax=Protopterus annectens TaxID=7888 RepID=UPI001CF9A96C|nr:D-beta-hydroxybutyrate dehydrogenase, mitochondrial-like [Protopterus annectens]